ncbi:MAG: Tau-tubulin kinase 2 [Paramarteilia canceri]
MAAANWKEHDMLSVGSILDDKFVIEKKISQGGYGQVFHAKLLKPIAIPLKSGLLSAGESVAIKLESKQLKRSVLREEREVLKKLVTSKYFMKVLDFGECSDFLYLVQTIGGIDLLKYVRSKPNRCVSFEVCFRLSLQMIRSLEYLHNAGFIHRDVKLSNYLLDQNTNDLLNVLKLIDFGICKRFRRLDGSIKSPSPKGTVSYIGTYSYSSIRAQELNDVCQGDDLVSVYYSIITMINRKLLPWREVKDKAEILRLKKKFDVAKVHSNFPKQIEIALNMYYNNVSYLVYYHEPDYEKLYKIFNSVLKSWNIDEVNTPFEWQKQIINLETTDKNQSQIDDPIYINKILSAKLNSAMINGIKTKSKMLEEPGSDEDIMSSKYYFSRFRCIKS